MGSFNAKVGLSDVSYFKVRVKRPNKADKYFLHGEVVGNTKTGQLELESGEKIEIQLYEKDAVDQNKFNPLSEAEFTYNQVTEKAGIKEITINPLINEIIIKKDLSSIKIEFQIKSSNSNNSVANNLLNVDVSELNQNIQQDRITKYATVLEKIKKKDLTYYNLITGNSIPLEIKIVPKTNTEMASAITSNCGSTANCILGGYAKVERTYERLSDISLENILKDGTIIKSCDLYVKLNINEKNIIEYAVSNKDKTDQYQILRNKIGKYNSQVAEQMDNMVQSGVINNTLLNSLKYKIDEGIVQDFMKFPGVTSKIYINHTDVDFTSQKEVTKTVAHEIKHVVYKFQNQLLALKWYLIRSMKNNYNYTLGDNDNNNLCDDCSSGSGHELYNPENKSVCNEECKY